MTGTNSLGQARLEQLLDSLTLERKVRLLTGEDLWHTYPEPAIGLRRMVLSDGPAGVRGETWDERNPSLLLPCPTALAASWDEALVERLASLLAAEASRKGVDALLAPTVNLHRSPLGGRHFECFSEDPLLTGRIGTAYVRGLQRHGVGATAKHYVANDSETDRYTLSVQVDERTLREVYLAPFEQLVVGAGAWLVMAAYNGVNGVTMTENGLLADPLKLSWGFDGVVVSDWAATRSTEAAALAGLDLAMPGPAGPWGDELVAAVRDGRVPERAVDEKVRRLLRLAARVGALDALPAPAVPAAPSDEEAAAVLRSAASAGMVLVRNEGDLLPLHADDLSRVAVIGPNASEARVQGGGSAGVVPRLAVSPLTGLRAALAPEVEVVHAAGVPNGGAHPIPALTEEVERARAVALARDADLAVVVVGTTERIESEGFDRSTLALPDGQDELVRAVAAANPRTVVVVNSGAPVILPWLAEVPAILLTWFPGQEFGNALGDVLLGRAEPGGRLPSTWAAREEDVPILSTQPIDGALDYEEGLHVGYRGWLRAGVPPAFPFGYGLGYTTWSYQCMSAPEAIGAGEGMEVRVRLRNSGERAGREVVQVYLSRDRSAVERPVAWLAGFAVVEAAPGDEAEAVVPVPARAFQHWQADGWHTELGSFTVLVGSSVSDIKAEAVVDVRGAVQR